MAKKPKVESNHQTAMDLLFKDLFSNWPPEWIFKDPQTPSSANQSESVQPVSSSLADKEPQPTNQGTDSKQDLGSDHNLGPSSPSRESSTVLHGQAGEHLVMADLLLQGIRVHMAGSQCPYDLLAEVDHKFIRIQVKSTGLLTTTKTGGKTACYKWELRRGNNRKTSRHYSADEFEIVALVATDIRRVAYLAKKNIGSNVLKLRTPGASKDSQAIRNNIDQYPFEQALRDIAA